MLFDYCTNIYYYNNELELTMLENVLTIQYFIVFQK